MNLLCDQCHSKFTIPDDKLPPGKTLTLKCPKCEHPMRVTTPASPAVDAPQGSPRVDDEIADGSPFGYLEEGVETALICESDAKVREPIVAAISSMGYRMTEAEDARNALRTMRNHIYDLMIVNELFNTNNPRANSILIFLERMGMAIRRNIFVVLLSRQHRTMDPMVAFHQSVDMIINIDHLDEFEKILSRGLREKKAFYQVFRDTMRKVGRV